MFEVILKISIPLLLLVITFFQTEMSIYEKISAKICIDYDYDL